MAKMSDAGMKRRSNDSAFPIMLDDVELTRDLQKKVVDLYTGCGESDAKAQYLVRCGLMLASNYMPTKQEARSVLKFSYPSMLQ